MFSSVLVLFLLFLLPPVLLVLLGLPRQRSPLHPVRLTTSLQREEVLGEPREGVVDGHADGVDEVDLHGGQLVHLVAVHHVDGLEVELRALEVALVEELCGDEAGHLLLDLPGLGDGGEVAGGHHGAAEEGAVALLARVPLEVAARDQGEGLRAPAEVDGQVGGQDGVLQHRYHPFEFVLWERIINS